MDPNLAIVLKNAWGILESAACSSITEEKTITFATVDRSNQPQVCSVVLRGLDAVQGLLEFYTDSDSLKCKSLCLNPKAQILIWKPELSVQLRLSGEARLRQDQKSAKLWERVPAISQTSYGKAPPTGTQIEAPYAYKTLCSENKFVVVDCWLHKIDVLYLKKNHCRAQFYFDGEWLGHWIAP